MYTHTYTYIPEDQGLEGDRGRVRAGHHDALTRPAR